MSSLWLVKLLMKLFVSLAIMLQLSYVARRGLTNVWLGLTSLFVVVGFEKSVQLRLWLFLSASSDAES